MFFCVSAAELPKTYLDFRKHCGILGISKAIQQTINQHPKKRRFSVLGLCCVEGAPRRSPEIRSRYLCDKRLNRGVHAGCRA